MDWYWLFRRSFYFVEWTIIFYVFAINAIYFTMMLLGYFALRRGEAPLTPEEEETLLRSPLVPAITVLAPAYNEALTIRESVRGMLQLKYPDHEVIVINDGSLDDTLRILIDEFRLYKSGRAALGSLSTKPIRAIYESRDPIRLVVIDKENGGKADSLNAGLNAARSPLVAAVDSDSLLEQNSLLQVVRPFIEDPDCTLATGGIIRVVNGCRVDHGRVVGVATPTSWLALFQTVEYLRAFLGGRVAFSCLNSLLIISGAFGLFRRDAVSEAGGFATDTVGEDMELIVRLHKRWRKQHREYRIRFVSEPVCWTEVPESWRMLQRQRNRWQRGTVESLSRHWKMVFRPGFGLPGWFGIPYFVAFEMWGPVVELAGYFLTIAGLAFHFISPSVALLFFMVAVLFGVMLSMSSVVLEEFTSRRYPTVRDVARLFAAAILENFGFRQILTFWRVQGLIDGLRGKRGWEAMERRGFQSAVPPPASPSKS